MRPQASLFKCHAEGPERCWLCRQCLGEICLESKWTRGSVTLEGTREASRGWPAFHTPGETDGGPASGELSWVGLDPRKQIALRGIFANEGTSPSRSQGSRNHILSTRAGITSRKPPCKGRGLEDQGRGELSLPEGGSAVRHPRTGPAATWTQRSRPWS